MISNFLKHTITPRRQNKKKFDFFFYLFFKGVFKRWPENLVDLHAIENLLAIFKECIENILLDLSKKNNSILNNMSDRQSFKVL